MCKLARIIRPLCATVMSFAVCTTAIGAALTTSPSANRSPATRPSSDQFHAQAIDAAGQNQLAKARKLIDQAYNAAGPEQRDRPLVLNRAALDLSQNATAMRAVRDLTAYLTKHRDPDEPATNRLGAALDVTGSTPRLRESDLWKDALREWERRNYLLDRARPGYHRWGPKWLDEQDYLDLRDAIKASEQAIRDQEGYVERAAWRTAQKQDALDYAIYTAEVMGRMITDDSYLTRGQQQLGRNRAGNAGADLAYTERDPRPYRRGVATVDPEQSEQLRRVQRERDLAVREEERERDKLQALRRAAPRPQWPRRFDMIALTDTKPPPIPPGDPKAAAKEAAGKSAPPLAWPGLSEMMTSTAPSATTRPVASTPVASTQPAPHLPFAPPDQNENAAER